LVTHCVYDRLSAFVGKCFQEAKDYIAVDETKIARTLDWIVRHQARNGSFREPPEGRVIHTAMQVVSVIILHSGHHESKRCHYTLVHNFATC